jgi:hypothetical protein
MKAIKTSFISDSCSASLDTVCTKEYTENPPYSCVRNIYPTFLTCLATALANASGAWSLLVIVLCMGLKIFWPHGSLAFDYDESVNRFLPLSGEDGASHWHHAKTAPNPQSDKVVPIMSSGNDYDQEDPEGGLLYSKVPNQERDQSATVSPPRTYEMVEGVEKGLSADNMRNDPHGSNYNLHQLK